MPAPRTGSIEPAAGYGYALTLAQEIHARAQKERKEVDPSSKTEFKISQTFERSGFRFLVSGRIDVLRDAKRDEQGEIEMPLANKTQSETKNVQIEEIKTSFDIEGLASELRHQPFHPYCLQLKTYAFFYLRRFGVQPSLHFHLVSLRTNQKIDLPVTFELAEYEGWLERRLCDLVRQAKRHQKIERRRKKLGRALTFPFDELRAGQSQVVSAVEQALIEHKNLMLQAPTGLGKTLGVLYPALKDALSRGQRLVYSTPKNSLHKVAEQAVTQIAEKNNADIHVLTMTAKKKLCFLDEPICDPDVCQYARHYYEKVDKHHLIDKLAKQPVLNAATFRRYGEKYKVCPFELSVDCIQNTDVVICDYNHVFSPISLTGRLSAPLLSKTQKPILVIDEAHNLYTRGASYFTSALTPSVLMQIEAELKGEDSGHLAGEAAALVNGWLSTPKNWQTGPDSQPSQSPPQAPSISIMTRELHSLHERISEGVRQYFDSTDRPSSTYPLVKLARIWFDFLQAAMRPADSYFVHRKTGAQQELKIVCCDASDHLASKFTSFSSVIAFSATLKPFDYYSQVSGFAPDALTTIEVPSPFPRQNRKVMIIPQVSTKYSDRARNYPKIAEAIAKILKLRTGNYLVFFPSFQFLNSTAAILSLPSHTVLAQQPEMDKDAVESFLSKLRQADQPTVLLAVQGGVFSEGVDYPGDMAIGAIIVGPGLPNYDSEREQMGEYNQRRYGNGFDFTCTYPAMTKVVQSAGRVIRSASERGLIVLMDRRFLEPSFACAMPSDWFDRHASELTSRQILTDIASFWQDLGQPSQ